MAEQEDRWRVSAFVPNPHSRPEERIASALEYIATQIGQINQKMESEILSLQRRFLNLYSRFGRFVSALKIPFPGNGDFGSKRRGSNAGLSTQLTAREVSDQRAWPSGKRLNRCGRGIRSVGGVSALAPGEARRSTAGADPQGRDFVIGKEIEN
jgi:hypothetical protein